MHKQYCPDAMITHVHMHVGLQVCAGILSCYEWLSGCVHQLLCMHALSKVHAHV